MIIMMKECVERKTIDIDKIRMRSLAGFFVINLWIFLFYIVLVIEMNNGYHDGDFTELLFWLTLITHTTGFPLIYYMFYYPQFWYAQMRADVREVEVIKEVEVLREIEVIKEVPVFREQQQPSVVIRNVNVKDGVMMNDVMD